MQRPGGGQYLKDRVALAPLLRTAYMMASQLTQPVHLATTLPEGLPGPAQPLDTARTSSRPFNSTLLLCRKAPCFLPLASASHRHGGRFGVRQHQKIRNALSLVAVPVTECSMPSSTGSPICSLISLFQKEHRSLTTLTVLR